MEAEKNTINMNRGVQQGDVTLGKIFIQVLDRYVLNYKGININGKWLNLLKFVDDVENIEKNIEEAMEMIQDSANES